MRLTYLLFIAFFFLLKGNLAAQNSLASKLGYDEDAKLLIIHADDVGVSHSENMATFLALKIGMVNSGSVKKYPKFDLPDHLQSLLEELKSKSINRIV